MQSFSINQLFLFRYQSSTTVIFPEHFEEKIGFDRVRKSVGAACMTDAAADLLGQEGFLTDPEEIRMKLGRVKEFMLMSDEEEFVMEAYVDIRTPLSKLKVPGNYLEISEVADLRKNLKAGQVARPGLQGAGQDS